MAVDNRRDSQAQAHEEGWKHFLDRLHLAAAGRDPGPDTWPETAASSAP